jgi:hypothetical protein
MMLAGLLALALAGAPVAEAWPWAAKRLPDGTIEYAYDFTALRASSGTADAREAHGEEAVRAFLKGLPREVKVRLSPGASLDLSLGRGPESRALAATFGQVFDGALETGNPLEKTPGAKLRPALHPDEPKLLVGAEQVTFEVRWLEDAALAAVETDSEWLRRELWLKVAERSLQRFKTTQADVREGALALAARVLAANACLDLAKLPDAVKADAEVATAVAAEVQRLGEGADVRFAPPPFSWSPELTCAWVRQRALAAPFEQSRGGSSAVLTYLLLLDQDAKLKALDARVRQRRDRFQGTPEVDALAAWRAALQGSAADALDELGAFLERVPSGQRAPPGLVALASTPFSRFLGELGGAERGAAWDELASAVQDGRVKATGSAWPEVREAALVPLVAELGKAVQVDSGWRDQARSTFALSLGGAVETRAGSADGDPEVLERSELKVRLMVPPAVEVEPSGELYARQARSLEVLAEGVSAEGLQALRGLTADGRRTDFTLVAEAKRLVLRLKSLALLATPDAKADPKELEAARRFVATWRAEGSSTRDVRGASASPWAMGEERAHAVIVGVTRRELTVGFASKPRIEILGAPAGFFADTSARQRYLVPALRTVAATAPSARRPLERAQVRSLVEGVQRDPSKVDTAVTDALKQ